jgi:hypothetical protein
VTEAERIDRQTLVRRAAALAGAAYVAPVLTSVGGASTTACPPVPCRHHSKCRRKGDQNCVCVKSTPGSRGVCRQKGLLCNGCSQDRCCDVVHECKGCNGNGACFCDFNGTGCQCMPLRGGICADFQTCPDGSCPVGQVCYLSCCPEPICDYPCSGAGASSGAASRGKGGPGMPYK